MAKDNLISGSFWEDYSQKVQDRMNNPKFMGEITEEEAKEKGCKLIVADFGAESCGDAVRLYWLVDEKTNIIKEAKFRSFGCGTAIASSDTMAELCVGKTVDQAVKITNIDVEKAMRDDPNTPAVPPQKMHCSEVEIKRYKSTISAPLLDRIDLYVAMDEISKDDKATITSKEMYEKVLIAFKAQVLRGQSELNAKLSDKEVSKFCVLETPAKDALNTAISRFNLSQRGINKTLKVARTIADLEEKNEISKNHIMESLSYRIRGFE